MSKPEPHTGVAYRIPRAKRTDVDPRIRAIRALRRKLALGAGLLIIVVLCMLFPRVLAFVELAAREIRVLWRLIAILALGIWVAYFFRKKRE